MLRVTTKDVEVRQYVHVDGFNFGIEYVPIGTYMRFESWVARVEGLSSEFQIAKSFGSEKRAQEWIAEMMQYPALIVLKYG
jgi:hypothetical protein